jgi:hypothetical protein
MGCAAINECGVATERLNASTAMRHSTPPGSRRWLPEPHWGKESLFGLLQGRRALRVAVG